MKISNQRVPKDKPILRPQARQHDPEYLSRLADSLLKGQLQPIGLLPDYTLIWGNARVLAARMNPAITQIIASDLGVDPSLVTRWMTYPVAAMQMI